MIKVGQSVKGRRIQSVRVVRTLKGDVYRVKFQDSRTTIDLPMGTKGDGWVEPLSAGPIGKHFVDASRVNISAHDHRKVRGIGGDEYGTRRHIDQITRMRGWDK